MKKLFKAALIMMLAVAMSIPAFAVTNTDDVIFSDISSTHYAYEAIKTMKAYGIISGYPDGTFRPNNIVSRVEFATMMVKALQLDINMNASSSFSDMNTEAWAIPFVEASKSFLTGYTTASGYAFKPNEPSVREDMAVALIKALKKSYDSDAILALYADQNLISSNLRPYVASAINNNLMVGETIGSVKYFYPQRSLTRAEAASLLMNVIREEKITFEGEEKVTFGDNTDTDNNTNDDSNESYEFELERAGNDNGAVVLKWDKINHPDFQGYKVVASKTDKTPVYPDNGYAYYITDKNKTTALIKAGSAYNGTEFSKFEAGQTYYFSVTALYKDKKVPSNTLKITLPGSPSIGDQEDEDENEDKALTLQAENKGDYIELQWTISQEVKFQGYKIVASMSDQTPSYPENGYYAYLTDRNVHQITISKDALYNGGDIVKFEKGKTYYFSITYLYDGDKKSSNVVRIEF